MTLIELDELGPQVEVPLTADQGRRLAACGVVESTPSPYDPRLWLVRAAGKVGVAQIGDIEVWIRPKVPIDRLLFLLRYAIKPSGWRAEDVPLDAVDNLVPALAQAMWRQTERAVLQGLLQGYRVHEDAAPVLRGRLRESDQMRRRHTLAIPLESAWLRPGGRVSHAVLHRFDLASWCRGSTLSRTGGLRGPSAFVGRSWRSSRRTPR